MSWLIIWFTATNSVNDHRQSEFATPRQSDRDTYPEEPYSHITSFAVPLVSLCLIKCFKSFARYICCCAYSSETSNVSGYILLTGADMNCATLDFLCSGIQFYLLLSPYLCFISLLCIDLYVIGDDALIS